MSRPEVPPDVCVAGFMEHCAQVSAWKSFMRLQWILNSAASTQTTEDELIERATKIKFTTMEVLWTK
jgi:hypothetical protein